MRYTSEFQATTVAEARSMLERHGVAVILNVVEREECTRLEDLAWRELADLTLGKVKRDDPTTWKNLLDLLPLHSMLIQHYGVGHMEWVWKIRENPAVAGVFAELWRCSSATDLLVSFDGVSIHMPPEITKRGVFRKGWLHTDQGSTLVGHHCWQGQVNLRDVNEGDATLTIMPGSHALHTEFWKHFGLVEKDNWFKLDDEKFPEHRAFFVDRGCEEVAILAPAGSLVLWDSRAMHYGREPSRDRRVSNHRFVAYVCMTPRRLASPKDLEKKRKAFQQARMTSHWPHKPKLFPMLPRTYGREIPKLNVVSKPPKLSKLGLKLAGM
eukprot:Colp12_sorted_trinity150504_noHs@30990